MGFIIGSALNIFMWKDEQFGLTFLAPLNQLAHEQREQNGGRSRTEGPGSSRAQRFSWCGFVFINVYCWISVVSVFNLCLELFHFCHRPDPLAMTHLINESLPFLMFTAVLVTNSAFIKMPKAQPWHTLLVSARWLSLAIGTNSVVSFF